MVFRRYSEPNQQLCQGNDEMMFVTMFIGLLNLKTGHLSYVNAAHNPPMLYRKAEDKFIYLETAQRNQALGLMEDAQYVQEEINFANGDIIFLYTDGVTEAFNETAELYGEERLAECLNHCDARNLTVQDILKRVRRSLEEYVGNAAQSDDITMLALSRKED